jgi:hypothetical protein
MTACWGAARWAGYLLWGKASISKGEDWKNYRWRRGITIVGIAGAIVGPMLASGGSKDSNSNGAAVIPTLDPVLASAISELEGTCPNFASIPASQQRAFLNNTTDFVLKLRNCCDQRIRLGTPGRTLRLDSATQQAQTAFSTNLQVISGSAIPIPAAIIVNITQGLINDWVYTSGSPTAMPTAQIVSNVTIATATTGSAITA